MLTVKSWFSFVTWLHRKLVFVKVIYTMKYHAIVVEKWIENIILLVDHHDWHGSRQVLNAVWPLSYLRPRKNWSCAYSLSMASWSLHCFEWLKSMIVTPKSLMRIFSGWISLWSMPMPWIDTSVDKADLLLFTIRDISIGNKLCSRNIPVRDWQNVLWYVGERITCIEHDKGTGTTLGVIEET